MQKKFKCLKKKLIKNVQSNKYGILILLYDVYIVYMWYNIGIHVNSIIRY